MPVCNGMTAGFTYDGLNKCIPSKFFSQLIKNPSPLMGEGRDEVLNLMKTRGIALKKLLFRRPQQNSYISFLYET
jgi:hypothetical protein